MKTKRQLQLEELLMWVVFWFMFFPTLGAAFISVMVDKIGEKLDRHI